MHSLLAIHLISVVIWVGGLFFAYLCVRPVAATLLDTQVRLELWAGIFKKFFFWVWLAIAGLVLSGHGMIATYGGFANLGMHIHAMLGVGYLMIALFIFTYFLRYRQLCIAVSEQNWAKAENYLGKIRHIVAVNLLLGLMTVVLASAGKYIF